MSKLAKKLFLPVSAVILGGLYLNEVLAKSKEAAALIKPVYIAMCLCFAVILVQEIMAFRKEIIIQETDPDLAEKSDRKASEEKKEIITVCICAAAMAVYLAALKYIGFCIPTAILLTAGFEFMKNHRLWLSALLAVIITAALFVVFHILLSVPLPQGFMGF